MPINVYYLLQEAISSNSFLGETVCQQDGDVEKGLAESDHVITGIIHHLFYEKNTFIKAVKLLSQDHHLDWQKTVFKKRRKNECDVFNSYKSSGSL